MPIRVLVVEDDLPTLELMHEVLRSFDIEVIPQFDSEEAFGAVNREKFDGIFLDLLMPRLNGFKLAEAIRGSSWNRTTPIIIVTSSAETRAMQEAFRAGANFYLQKPIDRKRLAVLLNSTRGTMLENRRSLQRVAMRTEISCAVQSSFTKVHSFDISARGILLAGDDKFKIGDSIRMSFSLPRQSTMISATGMIVRRDSSGRTGVSFNHISQTDRQRVMLFVADELQRLEPASKGK
jgi:CheY-like chemotaxis protein